jgi:hypothetical protein
MLHFCFCGGSIQVEFRLGHCNPDLLYSCVPLVSPEKKTDLKIDRFLCYFCGATFHNNLRLKNNRFEITVELSIYQESSLKEKSFYLYSEGTPFETRPGHRVF